jgi:hypothetical protein
MFSKVKDPKKYPTSTKPPELNIYNNGLRSRNAQAPVQSLAPQPPSMSFPYGFYPPPYMMPPPWFAPPPNPVLPAPNVVAAVPDPIPPAPVVAVDFPAITPWLTYCDQHPNRCGEDFSAHALKFSGEGYRHIHQLTSDRISVEKLSDWLGIGKGTADLLIQYAEEDVALIKAGRFTMA